MISIDEVRNLPDQYLEVTQNCSLPNGKTIIRRFRCESSIASQIGQVSWQVEQIEPELAYIVEDRSISGVQAQRDLERVIEERAEQLDSDGRGIVTYE
jgi:hypothetical protein